MCLCISYPWGDGTYGQQRLKGNSQGSVLSFLHTELGLNSGPQAKQEALYLLRHLVGP